MAFTSRLYAAAILFLGVQAGYAQAAQNTSAGIQMLPPFSEATTIVCPAGAARVLTWDGQSTIACANGVTESNGSLSVSASVTVAGQKATGPTVEEANALNAAPVCGPQQALTKNGAYSFACIDIGQQQVAQTPTSYGGSTVACCASSEILNSSGEVLVYTYTGDGPGGTTYVPASSISANPDGYSPVTVDPSDPTNAADIAAIYGGTVSTTVTPGAVSIKSPYESDMPSAPATGD